MVVYCCASGCFGCVWTHLLQMQSGRCLGNVITSSFRASESNVRQFPWVVWRCVWSLPWRWCRGAFEGGSPLRKRLHWIRCIWTHLLQMQSGRCLGSVITSSFRASESNVRQFSWVVWRCVFVWFLGRVLMVVYCCGSGCGPIFSRCSLVVALAV